MKMLKNKIFAIMISIFFMLSMTASMILVPTAKAQVAQPNPVLSVVSPVRWVTSLLGAVITIVKLLNRSP